MKKQLQKMLACIVAMLMLCQVCVFASEPAQETTVLTNLTYTTSIAADRVTATTSGLANATVDATSNRTSFYANGVYDPVLITEATQVAVDAEAKTFTLTVPYGTEVVQLSADLSDGNNVNAEPVYMLNDNGATKTVEILAGADTYTGTVAWAPASDASIGLVSDIDIYDLKYNQVDLWTEGATIYNITPSKLVVTAEKDFVIDADYYNGLIAEEIAANGTATTTLPTSLAAGVYVDWDSIVANANETTTNQGSSSTAWASKYGTYARHKLAYSSFMPWVEVILPISR